MNQRDEQALAIIAYALLVSIVITAVYKLTIFVLSLP